MNKSRYIESSTQHVKIPLFTATDFSGPVFLKQLEKCVQENQDDIFISMDPKDFGPNVNRLWMYSRNNWEWQKCIFVDLYVKNKISDYYKYCPNFADNYQRDIEKSWKQEYLYGTKIIIPKWKDRLEVLAGLIYTYITQEQVWNHLLQMNTSGQFSSVTHHNLWEENIQVPDMLKKQKQQYQQAQEVVQNTIHTLIAAETTKNALEKMKTQK